MLDDLPEVRRRHRELLDRVSRAEGQKDRIMEEISRDFGVENVKAARLLLKRLKREERAAAGKYLAAKKEFDRLMAEADDGTN